MNLRNKLSDGIFLNPFAWLLIGLVLLVAYSDYQNSDRLEGLCFIVHAPPVWRDIPTPEQNEMNKLCPYVLPR